MKILKIFTCVMFITYGGISNAAVNTALEGKQIQFNGDKPVYKTGTIIKDGKVVEYKKCQYLNPAFPNKPPADENIQYCPDTVETENQ